MWVPPQVHLFGDWTVPVGVCVIIMGFFVIKAWRDR